MELLSERYLYHHGIKGQKWGDRNGPPYPLGKEDYSAKELKENRGVVSSKSSSDEENTPKTKKSFELTDKQKKYLKIGLAVTATALVAYGGYQLYKNSHGDYGSLVNEFDASKLVKDSVLKMSDSDHLAVLNPNYGNNAGSSINCARCTAAFDLRKRGLDVNAGSVGLTSNVGYNAISNWYIDPETGKPPIFKVPVLDENDNDYIKKAQSIQDKYIRDIAVYEANQLTHENALKRALESFGEGARGHFVGKYEGVGSGHDIIWEVGKNGVQFMDGQINKIYEPGNIHEATKFFDPESFSFLRTDNLDVNFDAIMTKSNNIRTNTTPKTFDEAYKQGKSAMKKLDTSSLMDLAGSMWELKQITG